VVPILIACMGLACIALHGPDGQMVEDTAACHWALVGLIAAAPQRLTEIWGTDPAAAKVVGFCVPNDNGLVGRPPDARSASAP
jgi:hypothetical protein